MKMRSNGPALAASRQRVDAPADAQLHDARQPGARDVGAGDFGVLRIDFERDEPPVRRAGARASQIVL